MFDLERLSEERLVEIARLAEELGNSTDYRVAGAFEALEDLLRERAAVHVLLGRLVPSMASPCPLTANDLESLVYAANGFTASAQAEATQASFSAIKGRRGRAIEGLGAANSAQAIAICMFHGWITDSDIRLPRRPS